jgi:uncharacterized protein YggE
MGRIISILVVLVLAFASVGGASELPDFPFVYASGHAEIEVPPDVATITFQLQSFDKDPNRATTIIDERSRGLIALFARYKIDKKDIVAYQLTRTAVREKRNYTELGILGYETTRRFSVTLHALDQYNAFITDLLRFENLTNLHTAFDTSQRQAMERQLIGQASAKAREDAEALAGGFGSRILSVFAITASPAGFLRMADQFILSREVTAMKAASSAMPATGTLFVPNTIKLERTVNAIFKIKM